MIEIKVLVSLMNVYTAPTPQCQFNVYMNTLSTPITMQDTEYKLILTLLFCPLLSSL